VPRIVGGASPDSLAVAAAWYREIVPSVKTVSSTRVAEAAKLLENTFRAVNIGLINELAMMCHRMDIDVWEVIEAAKTKPFGFMPFYPGPGVGGHCIPLVPEFFSWKGRQFGVQSRFIHLAEEINGAMPAFTTGLVDDALNGIGKPVAGARVLLIGVSYKKDVGDAAESPALEIIARLRAKGAIVVYHDPFVPTVDLTNAPLKHLSYDREPLASVALTAAELRDADCTVVVTGHSDVDYALIAREARVIVDTRNMIDPALVPADTELVRL
jgi:UDP-N-acetyl-D-glucosamine dehydrogenase